MYKRSIFSLFAAIAILSSCNAFSGKPVAEPTAQSLQPDPVMYGKLDTAYLGGGCFWCMEGIFESLKGIKEAVSGYSGGHTKNPSYEDVCSHTTGHVEVVMIAYDPAIISYQSLLEVYFGSLDPTQVNGQGPDHGDSYRSVIFYRNETERNSAEAYIKQLSDSHKYSKPIAVSVEPFKVFYVAEDYHQNYERNHPNNPYIRNVSKPRIERVESLFPQYLKN